MRKIRSYFVTLGFKGLISIIKAKLTNSKILFKVTPSGIKHPVFLRIPSSDLFVYRQVFLRNDYSFEVRYSPRVIIDAGANIGLVTVYFANKFPGAKIISIEPENSNFQILEKNVEPYSNVFTIQAALWNKDEIIKLVDPGLGEWRFITQNENKYISKGVKTKHNIKAMTVTNIIQKYMLDKIDIFKIDIEGAEKEVFSDTSSWIHKVNLIIIELHDRFKSGCSRNFYCGSPGFNQEWLKGDNIFLSRNNYLIEDINNLNICK